VHLPNLNNYRQELIKNNVVFPLPTLSNYTTGLIGHLSKPSSDLSAFPYTVQTSPALYTTRSNWPKITIVTPSYNQAAFLEQTIRSVVLQNYPNLEYIVIDGGSTDGSVEILEKYSPWISYWQSEKDEGQGQAINKGFSLASGEIFAWLNSDDYYLEGVLYKVAETFIKYKTDFVYGYAYSLKDGKYELIKMLPLLDYFIKIPTLAQPSCFWRSKIHQSIWEELHCALDYELWLRLVKGNKRKLIKEPLSVAHVHDDAKTHDAKMKDKWHEDHLKIWADNAHGKVHEWKRIVFLNRLRHKFYKWFLNY
jgi:glycosyltransferase involved in cell wall biosynthesis